jgi:hypothetical protein
MTIRGSQTNQQHKMVRTSRKGEKREKYQDDFVRQVYGLALLGARDQDFADFFQVDVTTIDYWKQTRPDFMEALKEGKWEYDFKVVKSLGKRALGYEFTETETAEVYDKFGKHHTNVKTITKHIPADVTAIIFWLKNRQRALWADVNKTEIHGNINFNHQSKPFDLSTCTDEEKSFLRSIAIKKLSAINGISQN